MADRFNSVFKGIMLEKFSRVRQATDGNIHKAHALGILHKLGENTDKLYYLILIALALSTMLTRRHLDVTLYFYILLTVHHVMILGK